MAQIFRFHPTHPQPRLVRLAADVVRHDGVIAYPTDSSYALGCGLGASESALRIRRLRDVGVRHHLTLVCRDLAQVGRYARMDNAQFHVFRRGTPGGFTFLLRATPEVPRRVLHPRRNTIGIRIPDHPAALALLKELDAPILSTTLLLPGDRTPLNDAESIAQRLGARVDAIVDAGPCAGVPSTVVDLESSPPTIVRLGLGDPGMLGLEDAEKASN